VADIVEVFQIPTGRWSWERISGNFQRLSFGTMTYGRREVAVHAAIRVNAHPFVLEVAAPGPRPTRRHREVKPRGDL